ncbi:MAG: DNA polymerase III subunit delta' [Candidatus Aminicenantes bacterium]|nr:DNA polymerase III subunit delta' [Candidatus Aminicenantes bacterium]
MGFDDIVGNASAKATLRRALERRRVPQALLFVGPPGSGKRGTAVVLAQALNCLERADDACGACDSCRAVEASRHPDVLEIVLEKRKSSDEMKSELSIDQFRDFKQLAYLKPMSGRRRVFFWMADLMSDDARHSILKVLEEPPSSTTLILLSENAELVLPTVKSRCQTLVFAPITAKDIEKALRRRGLDEERARTVAHLARGNLKKALDADWDEEEKRRAAAWLSFSALARGGGVAEFLARFARARRKDVEGDLDEEIDLFRSFGRDVVLLQEGGDESRLLNPDYRPGLKDLASKLDPRSGLRMAAAIDLARAGFERNQNAGLLASALAARMTG